MSHAPATRVQTEEQKLREAASELGRIARQLNEVGQVDAARIVEQRRQKTDEPVAVAIVGEVKRGKSTLVNALVGGPVTATGEDVVTAQNVMIAPPSPKVPEGQARVHYVDGSERLTSIADAITELGPAVTGAGADAATESTTVVRPGRAAAAVTVGAVPRWVPGLGLIDTPGAGGLIGPHGVRARAAANAAGALLMVTDGGQVLTRPELDFLNEISVRTAYVVFALTKTDRTDGWETVLAENRRLLAEHAPRFADVAVYPVAAVFAEEAWRCDPTTSAVLEQASGVPALAAGLNAIAADRRRLAVANALQTAVHGFEQAARSVDLARRSLADPLVVQGMEVESQRLADLRSRRAYIRLDIERDLGRARAAAIAALNELVDDAAEEYSLRVAKEKGKSAPDRVAAALKETLSTIISEVQAVFVAGIADAVQAAFDGLEPTADPAHSSPTTAEVRAAAGETADDGAGTGLVGVPTLGDLVPAVPQGRLLAGQVELGRVRSSRRVAPTGLLDPSTASFAFMGSHLPALVGISAAGPFAPLAAVAWATFGVSARRSRERGQQLSMLVQDSLATLRRDCPGTLDSIVRELRPDLFRQVEHTLAKAHDELDQMIKAAHAATQAENRQRSTELNLLAARRGSVVEQRSRAEELLVRLQPAGQGAVATTEPRTR